MNLTSDAMTLKNKSVHLLFIRSHHVKFGEDSLNPLLDITHKSFLYITLYDLDLKPHDLKKLSVHLLFIGSHHVKFGEDPLSLYPETVISLLIILISVIILISLL